MPMELTVQQREPQSDQARQHRAATSPSPTRDQSAGWRARPTPRTIAVVLLGLAVALYLAKPLLKPAVAPTASAPPAPQVTVAKPVVKDVIEVQEFTGRFVASDQVDIRSRVAGYIETIHVADGALVKKGDPLFTIDQRPSKFAIEQAEAAIKNAKARIEFAQGDMARSETLRQSGATTIATAEQRRRDYTVAQADLQSAMAAAGRARLDLEYAQIKAPFAGRVSRKNVSVGNLVKIDDTILTTLVATDPIHFYFDVDERSVLTALRPQLDSIQAQPGMPPVPVSPVPVSPVEGQIALTDEAEPRHKGVLDGFEITKLDAENMVMAARVAAGWMTEEDVAKAKADATAKLEAAAATAAAAKAAAEAVAAAQAPAYGRRS